MKYPKSMKPGMYSSQARREKRLSRSSGCCHPLSRSGYHLIHASSRHDKLWAAAGKKAEASHIFIYILAVIIIGAILLLGYKFIGKLMNDAKNVEVIRFEKDIEILADRYKDSGTIKTRIEAPADYDQVCFIDVSKLGSDMAGIDTPSRLINDAVKDRTANIFLLSKDNIKPLKSVVEKIRVADPGMLCIKESNSVFNIRFDGEGKWVKVTTFE